MSPQNPLAGKIARHSGAAALWALLALSPPICCPSAHAQSATENAPAEDAQAPLPVPPVPPRIAEDAAYGKCLDMLVSDPSGADALAQTLRASAAPAQQEGAAHCHALAQIELGNTEAGAQLLDHLASASAGPAAARAVLFGQAAQAWTMSGKAPEAFASATQSIILAPDDPDLLIAHAIAALALQRYPQAIDDLTHALDLDPKRTDALILRASANRNLGKLNQAQTDINQAFQQDPENPDALLERGIIRQRAGNLSGARTDWQQAASLAPDTPTGDLAQQNLALLEAGPHQ